jgi:hypothetical protein
MAYAFCEAYLNQELTAKEQVKDLVPDQVKIILGRLVNQGDSSQARQRSQDKRGEREYDDRDSAAASWAGWPQGLSGPSVRKLGAASYCKMTQVRPCAHVTLRYVTLRCMAVRCTITYAVG